MRLPRPYAPVPSSPAHTRRGPQRGGGAVRREDGSLQTRAEAWQGQRYVRHSESRRGSRARLLACIGYLKVCRAATQKNNHDKRSRACTVQQRRRRASARLRVRPAPLPCHLFQLPVLLVIHQLLVPAGLVKFTSFFCLQGLQNPRAPRTCGACEACPSALAPEAERGAPLSVSHKGCAGRPEVSPQMRRPSFPDPSRMCGCSSCDAAPPPVGAHPHASHTRVHPRTTLQAEPRRARAARRGPPGAPRCRRCRLLQHSPKGSLHSRLGCRL